MHSTNVILKDQHRGHTANHNHYTITLPRHSKPPPTPPKQTTVSAFHRDSPRRRPEPGTIGRRSIQSLGLSSLLQGPLGRSCQQRLTGWVTPENKSSVCGSLPIDTTSRWNIDKLNARRVVRCDNPAPKNGRFHRNFSAAERFSKVSIEPRD